MTVDWTALSWREQDLGQAVAGLLDALGWPANEQSLRELHTADQLATLGGIQVQEVDCEYSMLQQAVARLAPALVRLRIEGRTHYLAVLRSNPRRVRVLTAALEHKSAPTSALATQLSSELSAQIQSFAQRTITALDLPPKRARGAERALSAGLLSGTRVAGLLLLRLDPGAGLPTQLRERGLPPLLAATCGLALLHLGALLAGWTIIGWAVVRGALDPGRLSVWVLALLTAAVLQSCVIWQSGRCAQALSLWLKQRLLAGVLRLPTEQIRQRGAGELLALVHEAEAFESVGVTAMLRALLASLQLLSALLIMALGLAAATQLALLLAWCALLVLVAWRYQYRRTIWSAERTELARSFVEQVVGQRTRRVQQPAERWHVREDHMLQRYVSSSPHMDNAQSWLVVLGPRGWLLLGIAGLLPSLVLGQYTQIALALAIGGVLQAYAALSALSRDAVALCGALINWSQIRVLSRAAEGDVEQVGLRAHVPPPCAANVALDIQRVSFHYPGHAQPVLHDCNLRVWDGERVLLEGPSGGGKSTLAALAAGLRDPLSGQIRAYGFDRATLGRHGWLQRVACVPQFHENHIFSAPLAFNLLMGRAWPPSSEDLRDALEVCRALDLAPLLQRMPCGLDQIIGETGWQLSHGERSRIFLARALLQRSEIVIIDESFGALDPVTLRHCMEAVLARARTLLVIAHP